MESEYINRTGQLKEYIKLHQISLQQDLDKLEEQMEAIDIGSKDYGQLDIEYNWVSGQLTATHHLLSVVEDIMG